LFSFDLRIAIGIAILAFVGVLASAAAKMAKQGKEKEKAG